jgi:hypothetical protein
MMKMAVGRRRVIRIDRDFANLLENMRRDMRSMHIENVSDSVLTRKIAKDYEEFQIFKKRKKNDEGGWL